MVKFLARVISVYTGVCWVHICVESWVVKLWYEHSVLTPGCVGYTFGLSGKVLAQAFSNYTGWCWVKVWVDSWVVKFWQFWAGFILLGKASEYKTKNFTLPVGDVFCCGIFFYCFIV